MLSCCSDVVELDLSFRMRIVSPSDSPGVLRSGPETVFGCVFAVSGFIAAPVGDSLGKISPHRNPGHFRDQKLTKAPNHPKSGTPVLKASRRVL